MTSADRARETVETILRSTLDSLAIAARGIETGMDVPVGEHGPVAKGEGNEASDYLRDLVLEQRTPKCARCTDFILTIGGPKIFIRSFTPEG